MVNLTRAVASPIHHAVAVDLGASSVRFAEGTLEDGRIYCRVIGQRSNDPLDTELGPAWNTETLLGICREAESHALALPDATIGIDSWGVDHGFLDENGELIQPPLCYRHPLHSQVFEELRAYRHELYALTGIQHQPFNTFYQLVARARQTPAMARRGVQWRILPELLHHLLGAPSGHELTQASTTQLMGLDGRWSARAFELAGWPLPDSQPELPGRIVGRTAKGVSVARVGSHDTASAVCGLGSLGEHRAFLNAGTWSLLGAVTEIPLASAEAESANLTNERAVDGRVRFLDNIPGFFVINRLHADLGVSVPVSEWLKEADLGQARRLDLFDPNLFNPASMLEAVSTQLGENQTGSKAWAGIALLSLVDTTCHKLDDIERLLGRRFTEVRVAGGGSASEAFCQHLASASQRTVLAGPQEATVLGNLAVQFMAQGALRDFDEVAAVIDASLELRRYEP
ncbi:MAG: hypothetical protein HZC36_14870 [Armatimonadetes bacterium]|nr:hypothetical protein [Armatimonadota bacterium]